MVGLGLHSSPWMRHQPGWCSKSQGMGGVPYTQASHGSTHSSLNLTPTTSPAQQRQPFHCPPFHSRTAPPLNPSTTAPRSSFHHPATVKSFLVTPLYDLTIEPNPSMLAIPSHSCVSARDERTRVVPFLSHLQWPEEVLRANARTPNASFQRHHYQVQETRRPTGRASTFQAYHPPRYAHNSMLRQSTGHPTTNRRPNATAIKVRPVTYIDNTSSLALLPPPWLPEQHHPPSFLFQPTQEVEDTTQSTPLPEIPTPSPLPSHIPQETLSLPTPTESQVTPELSATLTAWKYTRTPSINLKHLLSLLSVKQILFENFFT